MNKKFVLIFLITLFGCFGQFASDIYTPSLPAIAQVFAVSMALSQLSLVIFLYGVVLGIMFYGPLSEAVGRRTPLILGFFIACIGTLLCLCAGSITVLLVGRFIQGCGAAAGMVLWRTVFRDTYSGTDLAKYGSYFGIFIVFIIPAAPLLGGYLQHAFGWRSSFGFLLIYCVFTLVGIITLFHETSTQLHPDRVKLAFIRGAMHQLLTSRVFLGSTASAFLCYGAFFSWFTAGPVLLIHKIGLTPLQFGWVSFIIGGLSMVLSGFVNGRLVTRFGVTTMLRVAFSLAFCSGVSLLICSFTVGINFWAIVLPVFFFYLGTSFVWPNTFATAFQPFGHIAGYAGSLYSLLQIGGGALMSSVVAYLPTTNQGLLASIFIGVSVVSFLLYESLVNQEKRPNAGK